MKNVLALTLVLSSLYVSSANALITGATQEGCINVKKEAPEATVFCTLMTMTSLPTLLVGADLNEMSQADVSEFIKADAQNYLAGVDGEYLLLKATAKSMNVSIEEVAQDLLK